MEVLPAVLISGEAGEVIARSQKRALTYTEEMADHIATLLIEGWPLKEILDRAEFPSKSMFARWMAQKPGFRERVEDARRVRALLDEDEARAVLEEAPEGMSEVTWAGKRFDAYLKLAEVGDPTRYGKKVTVGGDKDRPIVFKLMTGVPPPSGAHIELNSDGTIKQASGNPSLPPGPEEAATSSLPFPGGDTERTGSEVAIAPGAAHPQEVEGSSPSPSTILAEALCTTP